MTYSKEIIDCLNPLKQWHHNCHGASIKLVRAGLATRVARGFCEGVYPGQHSWAVLGRDCYDKTTTIIDATLWSYRNEKPRIWIGTLADGLHTPHGMGNIWEWGRPPEPKGKVITLTPKSPLSQDAKAFLDCLGPLDVNGWHVLGHAPVEGWPAGEIYAAMEDTKQLRAVVPIDLIGMLTDRNPMGIYLASPSPSSSTKRLAKTSRMKS